MHTDISDIKSKCEKAKNRNKSLEQELNNQADYNKKLIADLMKEINDCGIERKELAVALTRLKDQINKLTEENEDLKVTLINKEKELKKSKVREATLVSWLKGENAASIIGESESGPDSKLQEESEEDKEHDLINQPVEIMEVGKKRVKVPKLNLTVLNDENSDAASAGNKSSSSSFIKSSVEECQMQDLNYRKKRGNKPISQDGTCDF